ncbi:MAG: hypothetical protein OEM82_07440 [Acidobacteriota bacterium]|nr:hypothetical protein [Acidobacteriota bacterium]MDH3528034.1 hypothetical protein [Acidobacteriota bacterium]
MAKITESEFSKICRDIERDRDTIIKHNPIGTDEEILLWMLLSVLHSYLSLSEVETPCFPGTPTADLYRKAIAFVLKDRKSESFDETPYLRAFSVDPDTRDG